LKRYLIAALAVSFVSIIMAAVVFSGLYGWNPLHLHIVSGIEKTATIADQAAFTSAIASVSGAISSVLALIVGAIAVIAVIVTNQSEVKSVEQLKLDFAGLASTLISLRARCYLYTNPKLIDLEIDVFEEERSALQSLLNSSSGLALYLWSMEPENGEHKELYVSIAGLVDCTTLDLKKSLQPVLNLIAQRASDLLKDLSRVEEPAFRKMSKPLSHLSAGLQRAQDVMEDDAFARLGRDMKQASEAGSRAPTEHELTVLKEMAARKIGGKAPETIEHFGRAAISGSDHDRSTFEALVRQLFHIELDQLPK
jgi:hypothetical protein